MLDPRICGSTQNDLVGIKYLAQMSNRRLHFNNLVSANKKAREILLDLIDECRGARAAYEVAVKGDILRLLAELFRSELRAVCELDIMKRDTTAYLRVAPALRHIAENYAGAVTLDGLASACCLNKSYFCRKFREVTGQTAVDYITDYRISKAEALLLTTDLSISEIAARVGFYDGCYFSRRFKALRGFPPGKLRDNQK
jgi:AraC-like DNA-binding protein